MNELIVKKINNYKFSHRLGKQQGSGWGIYNTNFEAFLTFDESDFPFPYIPAGGKNTAIEIANTLIVDESILWVKPLDDTQDLTGTRGFFSPWNLDTGLDAWERQGYERP